MRRSGLIRAGAVALVVACGTWPGASVAAQAPARAPSNGEVESAPIRCWWRTDQSVVHIAEHFGLVLTCAVIETSRFTVVPDLNPLAPTAVLLPPFEVVGGRRHEDIQAPPWRYFQFDYRVRLLGERFFGQEVEIPPLAVTYRIRSAGDGGAEGRDETYMLPALPMRIATLVSRGTTDIRDASTETFADIEARLFRATGELVASGIFFGFAAVLVGIAAVRTLGQYRSRAPATVRPLAPRTVLSAAASALARVRSAASRDGWTPELEARTLAIFRVAGAVALERPLAQAFVSADEPEREGQLALKKGLLRPRRALVSASTTPEAIAMKLDDGKAHKPRMRPVLEAISDALVVFGEGRYGTGQREAASLDAALEKGTAAVQRLRLMTWWSARTPAAPRRTLRNL